LIATLGEENTHVKIQSIILSLLILAGCTRHTAPNAQFTLMTTVSAGARDPRSEAWKVERMIESARFYKIAAGHGVHLRPSDFTVRVLDKSKQHIVVRVSGSSKEAALRAARAFAETVAEVLREKKDEFEISSEVKVMIAPVEISES